MMQIPVMELEELRALVKPVLDDLIRDHFPMMHEAIYAELASEPAATRYHQERNLATHLAMVGLACRHYAADFGVDPQAAFLAGLLHDVGKPFARKEKKGGKKASAMYTGHAQLGSAVIAQVRPAILFETPDVQKTTCSSRIMEG
jgi:putative nucleotidyltransferase with HDIG domain